MTTLQAGPDVSEHELTYGKRSRYEDMDRRGEPGDVFRVGVEEHLCHDGSIVTVPLLRYEREDGYGFFDEPTGQPSVEQLTGKSEAEYEAELLAEVREICRLRAEAFARLRIERARRRPSSAASERRVRPATRPRAHRPAARRADGLRSGTDPGDEGPGEPEPAAPADARLPRELQEWLRGKLLELATLEVRQ
jgi:hypothetical protein